MRKKRNLYEVVIHGITHTQLATSVGNAVRLAYRATCPKGKKKNFKGQMVPPDPPRLRSLDGGWQGVSVRLA